MTPASQIRGCRFGYIVFRLASRITTERGCTALWEARSWPSIMRSVRSETRGLFGEALSDDADKLLERGSSASAKLHRVICHSIISLNTRGS